LSSRVIWFIGRPSTRDRQRQHIIAVADPPADEIVDNLEIEARGRPDSADGAERSTERR
jgi:hypothetical protein